MGAEDADPAVLRDGPLHWFRDWPSPDVPRHAAGVYSIWRADKLVYAGMSGRGMVAGSPPRDTAQGSTPRLASHAGGRRSGDQFCVYVADRLVLPLLTAQDVAEVASGTRSLDALVRTFIHEHLGYRFVVVPDAATAFHVEGL